jgi:hypothetical protein
MKKIAAFLALLSFWAFGAQAQQPQPAFQAGEKITYTVFYNVMGMYVNAGTATLSISSAKMLNNDVLHVVGEGSTNSRYDWIFKVRDRYESYLDTETLQPYKFVRHIQEGGYRKHEELHFNRKNNTVTSSKGIFKVPDEIHDLLSSFYYARTINYDRYKPGDKISFKMFLDGETYNMYVRYVGKETIKTKYGKFRAIKVKPLLLKGQVFEGGENMTLWVTDDANHIPVRIESPLSVGNIKVDLMKHENLKYSLNSFAGL